MSQKVCAKSHCTSGGACRILGDLKANLALISDAPKGGAPASFGGNIRNHNGKGNTPEPQPDANGGEKQRLRNVLTNLLATVTSLAGISSIAVILSMLFVYIYAGTSKDTMGIASIEYARGMITLLFAVGTVVIALLLTLSTFFPSNENSDDKAKQRFDRGKEVLSLLIGIPRNHYRVLFWVSFAEA